MKKANMHQNRKNAENGAMFKTKLEGLAVAA